MLDDTEFDVNNEMVFVGSGHLKQSRRQVFRGLRGVAVELDLRLFDMPSLDFGERNDRFFAQNLPSMIAGKICAFGMLID